MGGNPFGFKYNVTDITSAVYQMTRKKAKKTFNGEVFEISYKRLKLKRREKIILQRFLGFLIRNNKPFSYSRKSLSELTGYSKSSIDESLNILETYRLIQRIGYSRRVKFTKGSILLKIFALAQNRLRKEQHKECTLAQKLGESIRISPVSGNRKTSLSLKHKEEDLFSCEDKIAYQEYVGRIKTDIFLGLKNKDSHTKTMQEWIIDREQIKDKT